MSGPATVLHASLAALRTGGTWRGALLSGPSGAGKSGLLLRLVDAGFRLVADDRVIAWASGGRLFGRAPEPLAGVIELRGQGMGRLQALDFAPVSAWVELGAPAERQPAPTEAEIAGVRLPRHTLDPEAASAPARLRALLLPGFDTR